VPCGDFGPEVEDEEIVRAMMVVRANAMDFQRAQSAFWRRCCSIF